MMGDEERREGFEDGGLDGGANKIVAKPGVTALRLAAW